MMYVMNNTKKQRLTAFIDSAIIKRAKVRGALEGLTISEIVEKALDAYAPQIEKDSHQHINLRFVNVPSLDTLIPKATIQEHVSAPKRSK